MNSCTSCHIYITVTDEQLYFMSYIHYSNWWTVVLHVINTFLCCASSVNICNGLQNHTLLIFNGENEKHIGSSVASFSNYWNIFVISNFNLYNRQLAGKK
jgi:hypothetical protein